MDLQTTLALYRTRLAERRTALSQLQLGFVLVTVPITIHAAFMMIAERHALSKPAFFSFPGVALSLVMVALGIGLLVDAVRDLARCAREIRSLPSQIERHGAADERPGTNADAREGDAHGQDRAADCQD